MFNTGDKLPVIKGGSSGDLMHSMVTILDNAGGIYLKVAERTDL